MDPFLTNDFSRTLTLVSGPSIKSANMCLDEGTMALEIIDDKLCSSAVTKKTARKYSLCGCYLRAADIIKIPIRIRQLLHTLKLSHGRASLMRQIPSYWFYLS